MPGNPPGNPISNIWPATHVSHDSQRANKNAASGHMSCDSQRANKNAARGHTSCDSQRANKNAARCQASLATHHAIKFYNGSYTWTRLDW